MWLTWLVVGFVLIVFLTGGSSRSDTASLVVLGPSACICMGFGLMTLRREHARRHRLLFIIAAAIFGIVLIQLVPLPPAIWQSLPGRDIVLLVFQSVGVENSWSPLSLTPGETLNALFALVVPFALLVLVVQLPKGRGILLLNTLMVVMAFEIAFGLVQAAMRNGGPANLYIIDEPIFPVGLFANRNHFAVFLSCALPMTGLWFHQANTKLLGRRMKAIFFIATVFVVLLFIFLSGSRSGTLLAVVALLTVPLFYLLGKGLSIRLMGAIYGVGGVLIIFLGWIASNAGRLSVLDRFGAAGISGNGRSQVWKNTVALTYSYFPFGSGWGSFVDVYQHAEPRSELALSYWNHAHNDWLESVLTGGAAAVAVLAGLVIVWALGVVNLARASGKDCALGWLGSLVILLLALASVVDYPLRTPALAVLIVIAAVWLDDAARNRWQR